MPRDLRSHQFLLRVSYTYDAYGIRYTNAIHAAAAAVGSGKKRKSTPAAAVLGAR